MRNRRGQSTAVASFPSVPHFECPLSKARRHEGARRMLRVFAVERERHPRFRRLRARMRLVDKMRGESHNISRSSEEIQVLVPRNVSVDAEVPQMLELLEVLGRRPAGRKRSPR